MHTANLIINDGTAREAVEGVAELFPQLNRKSTTTFIIKSINAVDSGTLMVSTENKKILWVLDFVSEKQAHYFQRLFSSIYIITKEQVIGLFRVYCIRFYVRII